MGEWTALDGEIMPPEGRLRFALYRDEGSFDTVAYAAAMSDGSASLVRPRREHGWIGVEDRLPEDWVDVRVLLEDGSESVAYVTLFTSGPRWLGRDGSWVRDAITHWAPLPDPPKEG